MERKIYLDSKIPYFYKDNIKYEINENINNTRKYKLAIVGSRSFNDKAFIDKLLNDYKFIFGLPYEVISGGAIGIDTFGENWAKENNIETRIFKPDWAKYGKKAGFIRNEDIIKNCDVCLAIWDGESHGTKNDIELCEKYKKDLVLYNAQEAVQDIFNGFNIKLYENELEINLDEHDNSLEQNKQQYQKHNRWLPQPGIISL